MSSVTINIRVLWLKNLETTASTQLFQTVYYHTSFEVWPILRGINGNVDGGAVPAHIGKGLLTSFLDFAGSLDNGLHELQVGAAQLSLGGHHAGQQLTVLGLVHV